MKIDQDLRIAIRSAYNKHKAERSSSNEWQELQKAAKVLCATKQKRVATRAAALNKQARKLTVRAESLFTGIGLDYDGDRVVDRDKFTAAGGVLPDNLPKRWGFDEVMASLAAANDKEGAAILKRIGINWN